jgi:hypothetical protein
VSVQTLTFPACKRALLLLLLFCCTANYSEEVLASSHALPATGVGLRDSSTECTPTREGDRALATPPVYPVSSTAASEQ